MNSLAADLRRVVSSAGIYAAASVAQRGVAFFLLPIYTRYLAPQQYGVLELLAAFSSIVFAVLAVGLPSALTKSYHRDCTDDDDRARILATSFVIGLPILAVGSLLLWLFAADIAFFLVGQRDAGQLVQLSVLGGLFSSLAAILLSSLRTQERALAFSMLTLVQFTISVSVNILLVAVFQLGVRGVLWGNLAGHAVALPVAAFVAGRGSKLVPSRRLTWPLISFGALVVPVALAGWVMNLSDRYLLRILADLDQVAVYGVGYKIGMVIQLVLVWPFQLAWPAISFSISNRPAYKESYAEVLTYFVAALTYAVVGLSILSRVVLPLLVGREYWGAYRVVPPIALAYALNGVYYCISPSVHIGGKTKYLPPLTALGAISNIVLNLILIPLFGILGAAWATVFSFFVLTAGVAVVGQRAHPVAYDYSRLLKIVVCGVAVYALSLSISFGGGVVGAIWIGLLAAVGFPILLILSGFLRPAEKLALRKLTGKVLGTER